MGNDGFSLFNHLISNISNNHNFDFLRNFHSYGVFVCGIDSYSGELFLRSTSAGIEGYTEKTIQNVWEDIKYVDLCILIRRTAGDTLDTALLGEIEGNKGHKLLASSLWGRKSSVCLFGIGVQPEGAELSIQNIRFESGIKTVVTLGSQHSVIDDFQSAVGMMEVFLSLNHKQKIFTIPGQSDVIEIIRQHWMQPIDMLIDELRNLIQSLESAALGTNPLTILILPPYNRTQPVA